MRTIVGTPKQKIYAKLDVIGFNHYLGWYPCPPAKQTSLDELPQFIQVLTGEMSIVGPRPHAVAHNELYRGKIHGYMLRHKVKPGITGWAQVNGWRGETDTVGKMEKRVEHDLEYIHHWGLLWDLKIIFLTVFGTKKSENAY